MSIFVGKDMVKEKEIDGVKFRIRPLTGEEEDRLRDLAGRYEVGGSKEEFKTDYAKMRTVKIKSALTGEGCGWSVPEQVTEGNIAMLKAEIREELCKEIDKLSEIKSKKKELPASEKSAEEQEG